MPVEHVNFWDIQNIIEDFLRNHMHVGFRSMQPSPFGQAYVCFNYIHVDLDYPPPMEMVRFLFYPTTGLGTIKPQ